MSVTKTTVAVLLTMLVSVALATADEVQSENRRFTEALQNGEASVDARVFYFDRRFDLPDAPPARAFTGGGIAKYETGALKNIKAGVGFYGSFSLFGIVDRDLSVGTNLLQDNTDDIAFFGEAYIDYDSGKNQLKAGRQRLSTPLINDRDFRMLPSVFEALVYRNKLLEDTVLEIGYLYSKSGFGSSLSDFDRQQMLWGQDGLAYVYGGTKFKNMALRGQFVNALEDSGTFSNFSYADAAVPISIGDRSYANIQAGGTSYQTEDSSTMIGVKLGTKFGRFGLAGLFNKIEGNRYSAVEAGPLYTDWQQGYANYEPSQALGIQAVYKLSDRTSLSAGYVDIESKQGDAFNLDTYAESVFDVQYRIDEKSHIRLRYSDKNQAPDSDREDRQDFRIIYYYDLSQGSAN